MRIQVNLNDEMTKRVDEYASSIGMSRSALCGLAIGQYMNSVEKGNIIVEKFLQDVALKNLETKPTV